MRHNSFLLAALVALILAILIGSSAHALDWHTANQVTFAWEVNATAEVQGELTYEVFQAAPGRADPVSLGTTDAPSMVVTLTEEGQFVLGVQTIRTVDGQEVSRSPVSWSDDPAQAAAPFGVMYYRAPRPTGLRLE